MKNIKDQLNDFFGASAVKPSDLARECGIHPAFISKLLSGTRKDISSRYADSLREAMMRLDKSAAQKAEVAR